MNTYGERAFKFGDYCLDTAKSIVKSHPSMNDIFEALHETRDIEFKERLITFLKHYTSYLDNCIKEIDSLLQTLPYVTGYMNDVVDKKELDSMRDKLTQIKKDTKIRLNE